MERSEVIMIRVSPSDKKLIELGAKTLDMSNAEFLRACAFLYIAFSRRCFSLVLTLRRLREPGLRRLLGVD
jgi:hypothetical protein